jgi:hypothetical protein
VEAPEDIDVEAIAYYCGATVVTERLHGSVARIIGMGDRAFITVDGESRRPRQRFSIAHELGHWMIDRGKLSNFVCSEKNFISDWSGDNPERRANRFAVDLLMPRNLFEPAAKRREITFATVRGLCEQFQTSLTATAIRLVECGSFPSILVCSNSNGIKWKIRDRDVPGEIQLLDAPGAHTNASELLAGLQPNRNPVEVEASDWFTHRRSKYYRIHEDTVRLSEDTVLSLLWWKDERQLIDLQD